MTADLLKMLYFPRQYEEEDESQISLQETLFICYKLNHCKLHSSIAETLYVSFSFIAQNVIKIDLNPQDE